jgi:phage terminase large subunit-like protein
LSTVRIQIPKYHKGQQEIVDGLARFNVINAGRRFGKDIMQRCLAIDGMERGLPVGWYEPIYKDTINNWDWLVSTLQPIITDKSEQERRLSIVGGGSLEMWSLENKDASRGRHYGRVIINEAAKVPHLQYSWEYVIRLTLMDLQGDAFIYSTPRGYDYFQQLFQKGRDALNKLWRSWQKTSWENPYIAREELEEAKNTLPEITYRQEIMAEFITSDGMVFRRVHDAAILQPLDVPIEGHQYSAGVDVAAAVDYTVITVLDMNTREMVAMDRFNRVDYPVLEDRIAAAYAKWNLAGMVIEENSIGRGVIDHLQNRGLNLIPFTTTNTSKHGIIQSLQSAFEHGQIKILDNPVLVGELLSFESKKTNSGNFTYSAPDGQHDDCVMSLALAWYALDRAQPVILFGA